MVGFIDMMPTPSGLVAARELPEDEEPRVAFGEVLPSLKQINQLLIDEALRRAGGNQTIASRLLGISHQALSKRLKNSP